MPEHNYYKKQYKTYTTTKLESNFGDTVLPSWEEPSSPFYSICSSRSIVSPREYIERIFQYSKAENEVYRRAVEFMRKAARVDPKMKINKFNFHRILIAAILLAVRSNRYVFTQYSTGHYQRVGGIDSLKEMERLYVIMKKMTHRLQQNRSGASRSR